MGHSNLNISSKNLGSVKHTKIQTYGCQGNEADSETMAGILNNMGYTKTDAETEADIILINTCAIRENAENRIWGELGRLKPLKRKKPRFDFRALWLYGTRRESR